jgi:hypothetical protein
MCFLYLAIFGVDDIDTTALQQSREYTFFHKNTPNLIA